LKQNKITQARRLLLEYIDEHKYLPEYLKELTKEQAVNQFNQISPMIAKMELSARRAIATTWEKKNKSIEGRGE